MDKTVEEQSHADAKDNYSLAALDFKGEGNESKFVGPISGKMWQRVQKLKSSYDDTFDWSVYDRLHDRFKAPPPRAGVVYKTAFKLINHHGSCSKCHYAFEVDTYGRGCIHNCSYCYAMVQQEMHGQWNRPIPFPVDLATIREIFYNVFETDKSSKWRSIMENRTPIRLGSMSDCFMWMDQKYKVTQEFLKILSHYDYPYIVVTKSDLVAHDDYLKLLRKDLASIQFSISGMNEKITKQMEPGAPSLKKRYDALKKLNANGFWTTVRVNPLFPTYPDRFFTDRESVIRRFGGEELTPKFDLFDIGRVDEFVSSLKEIGVPSVLAGFVRLSPKSIREITSSTGVDFSQFFLPETLKGYGDRHYSDSEIAQYYSKFAAACFKQKIRFSICYIGNGEKDYYQYQSLWSNKKDCCDALGNVSGFPHTSQKVSWEDRIRHAPSKEKALESKQQEAEVEAKWSPLASFNPNVVLPNSLKLVDSTRESDLGT